MDEFDFIKSIQQKNYRQSSLLKGVGDDAAVFRQPYNDIVTSVDTMVEGIHFKRETMDPFHIGYRALAANISDMAAMGAVPTYYLVSIVIPNNWTETDLHAIYSGMSELANKYRMDLIGGDTVSGDQLVVSITIIGTVENNKARYRKNAQTDDIIFVTGTLGDSAAGLHVLLNKTSYNQSEFTHLIERHRMPTPRVKFANSLARLSRVTLNDISDGISSEALEIAQASSVTMNLYYEQLPNHKDLLMFTKEQQMDWMLSGGEDYELIGTVAKKDWPLVKTIAKAAGTPVTEVGYVSSNPSTNGKVFLYEGNEKKVLNKSGYTHLK
ncbi:thiamine-phosphate kinase [Aquibacillus kalidii]|uniref:thiamine-phosphate kinase n=1 Tax=Aquibacillus kalidii TaxID=2762597 RepID=UPI00164720F2|nr:thiamine-phosphate kinase [Aquibacillus kalidii]